MLTKLLRELEGEAVKVTTSRAELVEARRQAKETRAKFLDTLLNQAFADEKTFGFYAILDSDIYNGLREGITQVEVRLGKKDIYIHEKEKGCYLETDRFQALSFREGSNYFLMFRDKVSGIVKIYVARPIDKNLIKEKKIDIRSPPADLIVAGTYFPLVGSEYEHIWWTQRDELSIEALIRFGKTGHSMFDSFYEGLKDVTQSAITRYKNLSQELGWGVESIKRINPPSGDALRALLPQTR